MQLLSRIDRWEAKGDEIACGIILMFFLMLVAVRP